MMDYITVREAARILKVSVTRLHSLGKSGRFDVIKRGGTCFVKRDEFIEYTKCHSKKHGKANPRYGVAKDDNTDAEVIDKSSE